MQQTRLVNMCLIHQRRFDKKPLSKEIASIQRTWNNSVLSNDLVEIAQALASGKTVWFNTNRLDTIIIDIDRSTLAFNDAIKLLHQHKKIVPDIAYESFSSNPKTNTHSYRMIFFINRCITKNEYLNFTLEVSNLLSTDVDFAFCNNTKQICFGTNKKVFINYSGPNWDNQVNNIELQDTPPQQETRYLGKINTRDKSIYELEQLSYNDFKMRLNMILAKRIHIGYDICLRWFFAESFNLDKQQQILNLASLDTQHKVMQIAKRRYPSYAYKLFKPHGNFYSLYQENHNLFQKIQKTR
ncbi:hypothetical protein [Mycoplasmopsis pullorum]|uniref:Uncharacterized protein n=1 Tax=Mycoplasmopsis pullorum TaxID=48003 RepID=A0A1L4FSU0_9BACT|nr:hypothetical protein [Mycoplasmopsis pullorum]APJ38687.1 hypothetical protein BLA55_03435 [Mycoplasmopsis pullorum]